MQVPHCFFPSSLLLSFPRSLSHLLFLSPSPSPMWFQNKSDKQFLTLHMFRDLCQAGEKIALAAEAQVSQSLCDLWWGNQWLCPPPCQIFMRSASRLFRWSMSVSSVDSKLCFPRWRNAFNSLINPCLGSECLEAQGSDRANYFHAMSTNILGSVSLHVIMRA